MHSHASLATGWQLHLAMPIIWCFNVGCSPSSNVRRMAVSGDGVAGSMVAAVERLLSRVREQAGAASSHVSAELCTSC